MASTSRKQRNQDYFDKTAADYDTKHEKTLNQLIDKIRARLDFIGVNWIDDEHDTGDVNPDQATVKLLDYACGPGTISRALAPYTTQCVGIDLSENMVAAYNMRAGNQGLAPDEMHAYQGDLCNPSDPSPVALSAPSFFDFDIAAVGLGLHHFDDPALAAKRLVERLRPGGVLLIIDFLPHQADHVRGHGCELDKEHSQAMATVTHHGFSPETIRAIFDGAGAGIDFAMDECADTISGPRDGGSFKRKIFLARGAKT